MSAKRKIKCGIMKATADNSELNKKVMKLKRSWDQVECMISGPYKKKTKAK